MKVARAKPQFDFTAHVPDIRCTCLHCMLPLYPETLRGISSHQQDPGLLAVARGCPKLEKLMLTGCESLTGESVRALGRGCVHLRELSLSGCGGLGNEDLKALAKGCTALRHLNIAQCSQVLFRATAVAHPG